MLVCLGLRGSVRVFVVFVRARIEMRQVTRSHQQRSPGRASQQNYSAVFTELRPFHSEVLHTQGQQNVLPTLEQP